MKTTETTVTATDNTIDLDTLARVSGGVTQRPNGQGCTGPNCTPDRKGPFGLPIPRPMPMPLPNPPFGDFFRRLGTQLGAQAGRALGGE